MMKENNRCSILFHLLVRAHGGEPAQIEAVALEVSPAYGSA
jgi:hypothetical protein